jgi:Tfp pilus assembly protein FimT
MKWLQSIYREEGFTIQEILVVLIVSSLLVSFGLSLFQFTGKLVSKWKKKTEVHSLLNSIAQRIALDVQKSNSVSVITDSSLVLEYGIGKQVVFRFNPAGAWRNDVQIGHILQGQFLFRLTIDSAATVDARIGLAVIEANAAVHVSPPWGSRQRFSESRKGWNAASNRH